ncbi:MAG: hypothetical protein P4L84_00055 [Isosphaeraceae bacterium]|nr:hypothetical protein [Isosphaeraceae bacterium]
MIHSRTLATRIGSLLLAVRIACVVDAADDVRPPSAPSVVAGDGTGLLIADAREPGIFRCFEEGRCAVFAPGSPKQRTPLRAVTALAIDRDGMLFAADRATREIYRVERGKPPVALSGAAFEVPTGLALDQGGKLIVCDLRLGIVARLSPDGGAPETLARVPSPRGIALTCEGDIVVLSMGPDQLLRVRADGTVLPLVKGRPFQFPLALVRDVARRRWLVSDGYARTIWEVTDTGAVSPWLQGEPLVRPSSLYVRDNGEVFVADPGAGKIFRVTGPHAIRPWPETR